MKAPAETSPKLPSGIKEARLEKQRSLRIPSSEIPWLGAIAETVPLSRITLQSGVEFFLGSMIRTKALVRAAENLDRVGKKGSEIAMKLFWSQIQTLIQDGYNPDVHRVSKPRTKRPIDYVKNPDGQRVYFMRFDDIEGRRVILRIAACQKNEQPPVLRTIAYA